MKTTLALAAPWLVLGVLLLLGGSPAPRQASEISSTLQPAAQIGFLGEIRLFAGNFTPPPQAAWLTQESAFANRVTPIPMQGIGAKAGPAGGKQPF